MLGVERRNKILAMINEKKSITVQETAAVFNVTEETIRRDFKQLEKKGLLVRIHGGAVISDESKTEPSLEMREGINIPGKDAIGKKAAELIEDYDTIILDASTSALYVAKNIKNKKGLTVITNAERIIFELSSCEDIKLISSGGVLRNKSLSYVGKMAETVIKNYYANKLFFSCRGFLPKIGLTDSSEQESEIRRTMMECSDKVIFLCDHTKFNRVGYVNTAKLDDLDYIITDQDFPSEWDEYFEEESPVIICADTPNNIGNI